MFNIFVNTPKGALYVRKFCRKEGDKVMGGAVEKASNFSINKAHALLRHNNENDTRQIASHLGWTITRGSLTICKSCANAKARQKNPKMLTGEKATVMKGKWFEDNSMLKVHKGQKGKTKIWNLTVDDSHGLGFITKKKEFTECMCQCI